MKASRLSQEHLEARVMWLNSKEIYSYMNMKYPITYKETTDWFERARLNPNRSDFCFYDDDELVAMSGLTNLDLTNGLIEFYVMVGPQSQGKGYGVKATEWTVNYAFLEFNINKVLLYTNAINTRANSLYEKLGFELEGTLRKHKFKDGEYIDRRIYGLLKEDWKTQSYYKDKVLLDF